MPEPEEDWVGRVIPPAPDWIVRTRWRGLFTHATYADPYACFAANRQCEQVFVREPVSRIVLPFAIPYTPPPDSTDVPGGGDHHPDPGSDPDDDGAGAGVRGGESDEDGEPTAEAVPGDDGDTGDATHLLLAESDDRGADAGVPDLRDTSAVDVLHEDGGVDGHCY